MMEAQLATSPSWLDVVAFDTEVAKDAKPEDVVFVDVGGGNGLQCAALKKAFPDLKGRIILQERHAVLEKALQTNGVETMTHDVLTEQPVKSKVFLLKLTTELLILCRCASVLLPPDSAKLR